MKLRYKIKFKGFVELKTNPENETIHVLKKREGRKRGRKERRKSLG